MATLVSIGQDESFMDKMYFYYKTKENLKKSSDGGINTERNLTYSLAVQYLSIVTYCRKQIEKEARGSTSQKVYLNWLRWNRDLIIFELNEHEENLNKIYKRDEIEVLIRQLNDCKANVEADCAKYFTISPADEAIINQYNHAFEIIRASETCKLKVLEFAGRLYINCINCLKNKDYFHSLPPLILSFTDLEDQGKYIIEKLESNGYPLINDIQDTIENYYKLRNMDDALRIEEDRSIEFFLRLAHKRATATILESLKMNLLEAIRIIKEKLESSIHAAWDATPKFIAPILHPVKSARAIVHCAKHPIKSFKELIKWVCKQPWLFVGIITGLVLVGLAGGVLTLFAPALMSTVIFGISSNAICIGASLSIGVSSAVYLRAEATAELNKEKKAVQAKFNRNDSEGRKLAREAALQEEKRQLVKEVNRIVEERRAQMAREDKAREEEAQRQVEAMSRRQLIATEQELIQSGEILERNLEDTNVDIAASVARFRRKKDDIWSVQQGVAAAGRLIEEINRRASQNFEETE